MGTAVHQPLTVCCRPPGLGAGREPCRALPHVAFWGHAHPATDRPTPAQPGTLTIRELAVADVLQVGPAAGVRVARLRFGGVPVGAPPPLEPGAPRCCCCCCLPPSWSCRRRRRSHRRRAAGPAQLGAGAGRDAAGDGVPHGGRAEPSRAIAALLRERAGGGGRGSGGGGRSSRSGRSSHGGVGVAPSCPAGASLASAPSQTDGRPKAETASAGRTAQAPPLGGAHSLARPARQPIAGCPRGPCHVSLGGARAEEGREEKTPKAKPGQLLP